MNREEFELLAASEIDGEISGADRQRLEEWLDAHPDDRTVLEEMKNARALLGRLENPVAPETPLSASDVVMAARYKRRWGRWAVAAAACFLFAFVVVSQGFVIQVGEVRVAFGPVPEAPSVQPDIQSLLAQGERISLRQEQLEKAVRDVALLQQETVLASQLEMEQFTTELVRELNRYFSRKPTYALYNPNEMKEMSEQEKSTD